MAQKDVMYRHLLLINFVQRGHYPALGTIWEHLQERWGECSDRTLQRDIRSLNEDLGIHILYDMERKGYYLDEEASFNLPNFIRYLKAGVVFQEVNQSARDLHTFQELVEFEDPEKLNGIEHFKPLFEALRNRQELRFVYYNFVRETRNYYHIRPRLLKEYRGRWYIIGEYGDPAHYRTFGLDRIEDLEVLPDTFTPGIKEDPRDPFRAVVGLNYSKAEKTFVYLAVDPIHSRYLEALPLHHSQEIDREEEDKVIFKYYLKPNFELMQRILSMGSQATLLAPQELRESYAAELKAMLQNYTA